MGREYKFRVWDILGKRMLQWGDIFDLPAWEIFPGTPEQRAFNVMQYTGLKDKNGREIYEGDTLRVNKLTFDSSSPLPENLVVKYFSSSFQLFRGKEYLMGLHLSYIDDCEVIGNIYENPELLEV